MTELVGKAYLDALREQGGTKRAHMSSVARGALRRSMAGLPRSRPTVKPMPVAPMAPVMNRTMKP